MSQKYQIGDKVKSLIGVRTLDAIGTIINYEECGPYNVPNYYTIKLDKPVELNSGLLREIGRSENEIEKLIK